jgi:hypothetical protein
VFLEQHRAAEVLVTGTIIAAALAEWVVTFRERIQTNLPLNAPLSARVRLDLRTLAEPTTVRTRIIPGLW